MACSLAAGILFCGATGACAGSTPSASSSRASSSSSAQRARRQRDVLHVQPGLHRLGSTSAKTTTTTTGAPHLPPPLRQQRKVTVRSCCSSTDDDDDGGGSGGRPEQLRGGEVPRPPRRHDEQQPTSIPHYEERDPPSRLSPRGDDTLLQMCMLLGIPLQQKAPGPPPPLDLPQRRCHDSRWSSHCATSATSTQPPLYYDNEALTWRRDHNLEPRHLRQARVHAGGVRTSGGPMQPSSAVAGGGGGGWVRAILDTVDIADVPESEGTSSNYRAAGGASRRFTRVLTATLRTVTDGSDRLVPIVAFSSIPAADEVANPAVDSTRASADPPSTLLTTPATCMTTKKQQSPLHEPPMTTTTNTKATSANHELEADVEVVDERMLRFFPRQYDRQQQHQHQQQQRPRAGFRGSIWANSEPQHRHGHLHRGSETGAGRMESEPAPSPMSSCDSLSLCHEYLTNSLRPGQHREVIRQRRQRSITPVPGSLHVAGGVESPFLDDDDMQGDEPSAAALAAAAMRRASFGSEHRGHGRMSDYYPYGADDGDADYGRHPKDMPKLIDTLEMLEACFCGYNVSETPQPSSPPPLTRLKMDPPEVENLISKLADVCTSVYVTVSAVPRAASYFPSSRSGASSSSSSSAARSASGSPPYYHMRVYGKWPKSGRMMDGDAMVCEIELKLDGWLQDGQHRRAVENRGGGGDGDIYTSTAGGECAGRRDHGGSGGSRGTCEGETRGLEDILALCVALKHDVPIYISRDVLDRFSLHPFGWQSSFHPRGGLSSRSGEMMQTRRQGKTKSQPGYFHTPADSDPEDPDIFDSFLQDLVDEIERPASSINAYTAGKFRLSGVNVGGGGGGAAADFGASVSRLTRILLKGPVAFFLLVVHFWRMWQRRWHGFKTPLPSLATQTGKHGVLVGKRTWDVSTRQRQKQDYRCDECANKRAQAAMQRSLPNAVPERRVFDSTIAEQAQLARQRYLELAMSDPDNAHVNLAVAMDEGREGGMDPAARLLLGKMRRRVVEGGAPPRDATSPWWSRRTRTAGTTRSTSVKKHLCDDEEEENDGGDVHVETKRQRAAGAAKAMLDEHAEVTRALAKVQRVIDHKSCPPLILWSLRRRDSPSEAMTQAQLAAMDEDWARCGAWVRRLREQNGRCIDHDVVYLPWRDQSNVAEDEVDAEGEPGSECGAGETTDDRGSHLGEAAAKSGGR